MKEEKLQQFKLPIIILSICSLAALGAIVGITIFDYYKTNAESIADPFFDVGSKIIISMIALSIPFLGVVTGLHLKNYGWSLYLLIASAVGCFAELVYLPGAFSVNSFSKWAFFNSLLTLFLIPLLILSIIHLSRLVRYRKENKIAKEAPYKIYVSSADLEEEKKED